MVVLLLVSLAVLMPSLLVRGVVAPLVPGVMFCAPTREPLLALTIDDGPGPGSDALLDLLRRLNVRASFFVIGSHLERNPGFVARALEEGHEVGNHLWRDGRAAGLSKADSLRQLLATERAIQQAAPSGWAALRWFRPGGGWFHPAMPQLHNGNEFRCEPRHRP